MNETARVACLVPGRVRGTLERDPARSGSDKILLLRQAQLADLSAPPAGVVLVEAGLFSHALIQWLGHGVPTALIDGAQAERLEEHGSVLLDAARGEMRRWINEEAWGLVMDGTRRPSASTGPPG